MMSVAYIGPKSKRERPRKTKFGTEVAHFIRDSDTTFEVKGMIKGQGHHSPGRFTRRGVNASGSCSGGNVLTVRTHCYVAICRRGRFGGARRFATHRGRRAAGRIVAAPAQLV